MTEFVLGDVSNLMYGRVLNFSRLQSDGTLPREPTVENMRLIGITLPIKPPAPRLRNEDTKEVNAKKLLKYYNSSVKIVFPENKSRLHRIPNDIRLHDNYIGLVEASSAIKEKRLRPAQWFYWYVKSFIIGKNSYNIIPPSLSMTLSPEKIYERSGWCKKDTKQFMSGVVVFPESYKELVNKYSKMKFEIIKEGKLNRVKSIYSEHFSDSSGSYNTYIDKIKEESVTMQARFKIDIENCEILWG